MSKAPKVNYVGVFLDDASMEALANKYKDSIPVGWTWSGHHMTIEHGKDAKLNAGEIGTQVTLTVNQLGKSADAWAVKVDGFRSKNAIPHITLAYRVKPVDSNDIKNWEKIEEFTLTGKVGILNHGSSAPVFAGGRRKTRRAVKRAKKSLRKKVSRRA